MALTATYNRIIDLARSFGTRHAQIAKFEVGNLEQLDADTDKKTDGVYLMFDIERMTPIDGEVQYTLIAYIMDMVLRGEEQVLNRFQSVTNVHNDTMLIALDMLSFFRGVGSGTSSTNCVGVYEDLDLIKRNISIEPFYVKTRNGYAGVELRFDIKVPYDWDRGVLPLDIQSGGVVPSDTINITIQDTSQTVIELFSGLTPSTQTLVLSNAYLVTTAIQVVNQGDGQVGIIQVV